MNVSKLNYFTTLLLSGTLGIVVAFFYLYLYDGSVLDSVMSSDTSFLKSSIAALAFIVVVVLAGITVDSISALSVRRVARMVSRNEKLARFLLVDSKRRNAVQLRSFYEEEVGKVPSYKKFLEYERREHFGVIFISSYFLHFANDNEMAWVVQHYTNYRLASNFFVFTTLSLPAAIWALASGRGEYFAILVGLLTIVSYLLLSFAAREHLRTGRHMLAQAVLHAIGENSKVKEDKMDTNNRPDEEHNSNATKSIEAVSGQNA